MNETVNQENPATQEEREERTFTQSEMDAMNRAKPVAPYGTTGCPPKRACHSPQEKIRPEQQPTYHLILLLLLAAREKDASCDASFFNQNSRIILFQTTPPWEESETPSFLKPIVS